MTCAAGWTTCATFSAARDLPVFFADNHAETFGWITRTFDLDEARCLVLVDAHSDASAAERSDDLREQVRRVASEQERVLRVEGWRAKGRIQAFNWLEPLLPSPVERVLWVPRVGLTDGDATRLTREAVESLDGRLEVEPRAAGSFAGRWQTTGLTELAAWDPGLRPVVLAVDLDFFAGLPDAAERLEDLWRTAMRWPGLDGVAFAISRPWLHDDREADELVLRAVDAVRRTRGAGQLVS